jgi:hypothetical protein
MYRAYSGLILVWDGWRSNIQQGLSYNFEQVASLTKGGTPSNLEVYPDPRSDPLERRATETRYDNDADFIANIPGTLQVTWGLSHIC